MIAEGLSQTITELRRSIAWMDLVMANLVEGVVVLDDQARVQYANDCFVGYIGELRIHILGMTLPALVPGLWEQVQARLPSAKAGFVQEFAMDTTTGARTFLVTVTALAAMKQTILVFQDITEHRLLESRARQAEKMSAVGQLAAGVAHEINNPIGVILGFAQSMSSRIEADDAYELPIKSIEREALRCKTLVQNLLTFSRASPANLVLMDLNAAVEQTLALISAQAKMKTVAVTTRLAPGLPRVMGNMSQLEQVIVNLAANALYAMSRGGELVLSTERIEQGADSWVCLKCVDTGAGIPPEILPKIFDPFFTTKKIGEGTGLGLSLVSEIIHNHSGEISVESRPGRTEFAFKLPAGERE